MAADPLIAQPCHGVLSRVVRVLSWPFVTTNPLPELGSRSLESIENPKVKFRENPFQIWRPKQRSALEAPKFREYSWQVWRPQTVYQMVRSYFFKMWLHGWISWKDRKEIIEALDYAFNKVDGPNPLSGAEAQAVYGKSAALVTLHDVIDQFTAGVINSNKYFEAKRKDRHDRDLRPWVIHTKSAAKWTIRMAFILIVASGLYVYVQNYNAGGFEMPAANNRMDSYEGLYRFSYGNSPRPYMSPQDEYRLGKGYVEEQRGIPTWAQYSRAYIPDANLHFSTEYQVAATAKARNDEKQVRLALMSIFIYYKTHPDNLRIPDYGKMIEERVHAIFDEFDPTKKYWNEFQDLFYGPNSPGLGATPPNHDVSNEPQPGFFKRAIKSVFGD